jgi:hypothetical protein
MFKPQRDRANVGKMAADRGGKGLGSIDFLITSLIVVVSPGTGVLFTLAAGLARVSA